MSLPTRQDAAQQYGSIVNGVWADAAKHCSLLPIPPEIGASWINTITRNPVVHIYCNKDMQAPLMAALQNVSDRGLLTELKTFDGCFMSRDVRGLPGVMSWHSLALAIDINASTNQLGQLPTLSPEFVACFADVGFVWGGNFSRKDGMHFQWAVG